MTITASYFRYILGIFRTCSVHILQNFIYCSTKYGHVVYMQMGRVILRLPLNTSKARFNPTIRSPEIPTSVNSLAISILFWLFYYH